MANYIVPILLLALGGLGWMIRQEFEKRRQIEEQLSQEKFQTYMIFVNAIFSMFHQDALARENIAHERVEQDDFVVQLQEFSKKVIFYGSDEVIREYQALTSYLQQHFDEGDFAATSEAMAKVIVAIRKDMGYPDTKFTPKTFVKQLSNDYHLHTGPGGMLHDFDQKYGDI